MAKNNIGNYHFQLHNLTLSLLKSKDCKGNVRPTPIVVFFFGGAVVVVVGGAVCCDGFVHARVFVLT